jgi:hypothetical protein
MNGGERARPRISGDGAVVTVFQKVRQTRMLTSGSGCLTLIVLGALPLVLDPQPGGILGRDMLGSPTLSARIGQRRHHGYRPHESKKHHCR